MIRPISIALVYGGNRSAEYARTMKSLILSKCESLPVIPLLVDSTTDNAAIWSSIESTFESSDYAFVFLSEVYIGYKADERVRDVSMSTPNLMLEYGYLIHKLGKERIKLILDFDYSRTADGSFVFPSDCSGDFRCSLTKLSSASNRNEIEAILEPILNNDLNALIQKYNLSSIDDINHQRVGINSIFQREFDEGVRDYSIEKQYSKFFGIWTAEMDEFSQMKDIDVSIRNKYVLSYVYSRLLFYPALHEINIKGLNIDLFKVSDQRFPGIMSTCGAKSYNAIIDYIKGGSNTSSFYTDIAAILESNSAINMGLPDVIVKNYLGLCYLNAAINCVDKVKVVEYCNKAFQLFSTVIELAGRLFAGTITETMLRAFSFYNRARAGSILQNEIDSWTNDFDRAEIARRTLSEHELFPLFIQNYFKQEMYHCINGKIFFTMQQYDNMDIPIPEDLRERFSEMERGILDELKIYEQTVVASQSFFKKVKERAEANRSRLSTL